MNRYGGWIFCMAAVLSLRGTAQHPEKLDITRYDLELSIPFVYRGWEVPKNTLSGKASISFINTDSIPVRTLSLLLHRLLLMDSVSDANGRVQRFDQQVHGIEGWKSFQLNSIKINLNQALNPGDSLTLHIYYSGFLSGYPESGMLYVKESLDPAFTIIRPESFSYPQLMDATEESLMARWRGEDIFDQEIKITIPSSHIPAIGYRLANRLPGDGMITWVFASDRASGSVIIPIAPYRIIDKMGFKIFYLEEDEKGAQHVAEGIEKVMALYESWLGPLNKPTRFSLVEIPDGYGSQALMPTIIQTASSFKDKRSMGELYHEISHFWNVRDKETYASRWNEGLAMYLQFLAYEALNEEGTLIPSIEKRLLSVKNYLNDHPQPIAMIDYGKEGVTSTLSYSAGSLFFYVLGEVMGREKLLRTLGEFYRQYEEGATSKEFATFMSMKDGKVKKVFDDWFFSGRYMDLIRTEPYLASIVDAYR